MVMEAERPQDVPVTKLETQEGRSAVLVGVGRPANCESQWCRLQS